MRVGSFLFSAGWISTLVTASLLGLLIWLGAWQAGRAEEKLAMQTRFDEAAAEAVLYLGDTHPELESLHFNRIEMDGEFEGQRQFLLDNRTHLGKAGYHVLTPLRMKKDLGVLVNRGWVPTGPDRGVLPDISAPAGKQRLQGILFPPPRVFLLGSAGYESGGWPLVVQSVDIEHMQRLLGYALLGSVVMMDPGSPEGYVRRWKPYYGITPERHRAYSFQWFSLAGVLLILYLAATVRRIPGDAPG